MSSEKQRGRTTVSIDASIMTGLEEFCELYNISGKSNAVETLLAVTEATGIPLTPSDTTEQTRELNLENVHSVRGFVFSNPDSSEPGLQIIGSDASNTRAITNTSTPSSPIQPLPRTNITNGNVICPACGEELLSYDLSDSLPGVESGVFNSLTVYCDTCDASRPQYTLFVAQPGASTSKDVLMGVMESHFAFLLVTEAQTQKMFNKRIEACKSLAEDGGVSWLPEPTQWIGYEVEIMNYPSVSVKMYYEFLKSYIVYLINQEETIRLMDVLVQTPETKDEFQIKVETRGSPPTPAFETLQTFSSHWEDIIIQTKELQENTFAEYTYTLTLQGL